MNETRVSSSPGVAAVLSFLVTGLGQIYNGQIRRGLWLMTLSTVGLILLLVGLTVLAILLYHHAYLGNLMLLSAVYVFVGGVVVCLTGIHSIADAYKRGGSGL